MRFLLLEGVTQIALMPQRAGTASSSQTTAPLWFPFNTLRESTAVTFLMASLCKMTSPNWRVVEFGLEFFLAAHLGLLSTEHVRTLNASSIGSATRQPATLWEETNRYTCKYKGA